MGVAHATVTLANKSGIVRDAVVNTFTFQGAGDFVTAADVTAIKAALSSFYNDVHAPGARALGSYFSTVLSRTVNPILRVYDIGTDLNGTPAGSPLFEDILALLANNVDGSGLPSEVALALSFHADFGADVEFGAGTRPRARDRGRVYLGPLALDAVQTTGTPMAPQPVVGVVNAALGAGASLRDADIGWSVWSRAAGTVKAVSVVSVDNAFDIQRRRGEKATNRVTA